MKQAKAPPPPDYVGLAKQQGADQRVLDQQQTQANRPTQVGPDGTVSWAQDPTTKQWTQNTVLSQGQQGLYDQRLKNQGQAMDLTSSAMSGFNPNGGPGQVDYSSLGKVPGQVDYSSLGAIPQGGQYVQKVTDTIRALQQPDLARRRDANDARMAAMGLGSGTGQANSNMQQDVNDSEGRADLNAIMAGYDQGNTEFGQNMQGYQQGAANLNNQFGQNMQGYQQGANNLNNNWQQGMAGQQQKYSQLSGLMGLGGSASMPASGGFMSATGSNADDLMNSSKAAHDAQVAAANAKNASKSGMFGSILGAAGTVFGGPLGGMIGSGLGGLMGGGGSAGQSNYANSQAYGPPMMNGSTNPYYRA